MSRGISFRGKPAFKRDKDVIFPASEEKEFSGIGNGISGKTKMKVGLRGSIQSFGVELLQGI